MFWIVQKNLFTENKRNNLINALDRLGIKYLLVDVENYKITPEIPNDINDKIITNGSIMLSKIAVKNKWEPGSFFNENLSFEVWGKHYKDFLLNKDSKIIKIKDIDGSLFVEENVFARPILDDKSFNGKIFSKQELIEFKQKTLNAKKGYPNPETEIMISKVKKIGQEHRHYIVNGEVITSSRYKLSGSPNFSEGADQYIVDFVKKAIDVWQPAQAFVLDTYVAGDEVGIVEIGCICHAGLYESDIMKLVDALDNVCLSKKKKIKY